MKYIKVYNNEEDYHALKETHDYPAFAYTKDTDKVWHWVTPYINCVGYEMQFEEDRIGNPTWPAVLMTWVDYNSDAPYDWIEKVTINDEEIDLMNWNGEYVITSTTMTVMTYLTKDWWEKYSPYLSRFDNGEINSCYILRADDASKLFLGQLDTSLVTSMNYLFIRSDSGSMDVLDLSTWDTSSVVNMENMFTQYMEWPYLNVEEIKLPENFGKNCNRMWSTFSNCPQLTKINLENVNTRACQTMEWLFSGDESITDIDLRTWSLENVENMSKMFQGCHNLTAVTITDSIRSGIDVSDMFTYVETYGIFYFNCINNYDHIIEQLPSTWQVVPLFGNELGIYFHKHNIPYNKTYNCTSWDIDNLLWDQIYNNVGEANLDDNSDYSESDSFDISNPIIFLPINGRFEPITHLTYKYNETDTTWYEKFVATFDSCTLTYECKSSAHDVWETKDDWFGTVHFQTNEPTILSYDVVDWFKDCEGLPEFSKTYNLAYSGSFVKECIENFVNNYTDFFGEDYFCWGLTFNNHYLEGYDINDSDNEIQLYFQDGEIKINYADNSIELIFQPTNYIIATYNITSTTTPIQIMFGNDYSDINLSLSQINKVLINDKIQDKVSSAYTFSEMGENTVLISFDTQKLNDLSGLFSSCYDLTSIDLSNFDTSNVTNMNSMFNRCSGLTSITFGENFNTSNVTDMRYMFEYCLGLTSLDLSSFNTRNVTYTSYMFYNCRSLTSLDLSNFDLRNVLDTSVMLDGCHSLTSFKYFKKTPYKVIQVPKTVTSVDLSNYDTSYVSDMSHMFQNCNSLTSITWGNNFNTSNVTKMNYMFDKCRSLASLDLSNFDVSKVTGSTDMFYACNNLASFKYFKKTPYKAIQVPSTVISIDLSAWDMSNVTSLYRMFRGCSGLTSIDLSNVDTSKVTNMSYMFDNCKSLTSITFGSQADVSQVTSYSSMFNNITTTGALTYPSAYENAWNNIIVTNQSTSNFPSTWTAMAVDYENQE